jgi:hypothetical protein
VVLFWRTWDWMTCCENIRDSLTRLASKRHEDERRRRSTVKWFWFNSTC